MPTNLPSTVFHWEKMTASPTPKGQCRNLYDRATATLDRFECHITTLNPGEVPHEPHRHPDEELIIIKEGKVEVTINGAAQTAGPGSVIFLASQDLHGLRNPGEQRATYFVQRWTSPGLEGPKPPND